MYFGPTKIISVDEDTLVVVFNHKIDVEDIRQQGVSAVALEAGLFVLIGNTLVIPVGSVLSYSSGVRLMLAGGDPDQLYPQDTEILNLDARTITKLEVWAEMTPLRKRE